MLTSAEGLDWMQVGESEIYVSDLIDRAGEPAAEMTVGYARLEAGEEMEISFPYDEVLTITRGAYTVRSETGEALTARAGDVIYLPSGSRNQSRAEEDTEMVYVAAPASVYADHVAAAAAASGP
jgi:ethanolamine utilization protein EutQ (cupin superfamily)